MQMQEAPSKKLKMAPCDVTVALVPLEAGCGRLEIHGDGVVTAEMVIAAFPSGHGVSTLDIVIHSPKATIVKGAYQKAMAAISTIYVTRSIASHPLDVYDLVTTASHCIIESIVPSHTIGVRVDERVIAPRGLESISSGQNVVMFLERMEDLQVLCYPFGHVFEQDLYAFPSVRAITVDTFVTRDGRSRGRKPIELLRVKHLFFNEPTDMQVTRLELGGVMMSKAKDVDSFLSFAGRCGEVAVDFAELEVAFAMNLHDSFESAAMVIDMLLGSCTDAVKSVRFQIVECTLLERALTLLPASVSSVMLLMQPNEAIVAAVAGLKRPLRVRFPSAITAGYGSMDTMSREEYDGLAQAVAEAAALVPGLDVDVREPWHLKEARRLEVIAGIYLSGIL